MVCKADCDFPELLMNKSDAQVADLARKIIPVLPRDVNKSLNFIKLSLTIDVFKVQETCRNGLGKFLRTNASSINITEINKFLCNLFNLKKRLFFYLLKFFQRTIQHSHCKVFTQHLKLVNFHLAF